MRYKIYPLIKKNKFNCVFLSLNIVIVSKNLKSLQTNISVSVFIERKKSTNILVVSVLGGPTRWNTPQSVQTC